MRVCVVTVAAHGLGGMQDHGQALVAGLAAAGHTVEVIAPRHPAGIDCQERDGARWHYLPVPAFHPRLPRRHPEWFSGSYERFRSLHREQPFDVVHSESTSALELLRRGVHHEVPIVVKFHGSYLGLVREAVRRARSGDARTFARELKRILWNTGMHLQRGEWRRFRPCEWMVPSRHQFEDTLHESFLRRERGHVVPNGVDTTLFRARPKEELREALGLDDGRLWVTAGRLERAKGNVHAIDALALLGDEFPEARLAVLGDGEDRSSLERQAERLGVAERVLFLGFQPQEVVADYLAAADAFIFPSELNEAAPLVPLQAMASGAPVVASAVGSLGELIDRPGENGLLVPPGEPRALANALGLLAREPERARAVARGGQERVASEYTLERMLERTITVYELAIARAA